MFKYIRTNNKIVLFKMRFTRIANIKKRLLMVKRVRVAKLELQY